MREKILKSANEQIERFGLKKFTVDDIATDLGISKKTIYKYFESKRQIIGELFDRYMEAEKKSTLEAIETEDGWLNKLKAVISCYGLDWVSPQRLEELQLLFPEEWEKTEAIRNFKKDKAREILLQGIESGFIKKDINLNVLGLILDKTISSIFDYKTLVKYGLTVDQAMNEVNKIIMFGIIDEISLRGRVNK